MKRALDMRVLQGQGAVLSNEATAKKQKVLAEEAVLTEAAVAEVPAARLEIIVHPANRPLDRHPHYDGGQLYAVLGQRMSLQVRATDERAALTQISWTLDDHTVKECVQTSDQGTAVRLAAQDLKAENIIFHWITGGLKNVRVTATVNGVEVTATGMVEVLAPTVDWFHYTTANVTRCEDGEFTHEGRWLALWEPAPNRRSGCTGDARVRVPHKQIGTRTLGAGQVGFIQVCGFSIIMFDFAAHSVPPPKVLHTALLGDDVTALDTEEPGTVCYTPEEAVDAGGVVTLGYHDSPAQLLPMSRIEVTVKDLFRTYLVYKCNVAGSIWVTLQRAEWRWEAEIKRLDISDANSAWGNPANVVVFPAPHRETDAQPTHELPTWTERASTVVARGPVDMD